MVGGTASALVSSCLIGISSCCVAPVLDLLVIRAIRYTWLSLANADVGARH